MASVGDTDSAAAAPRNPYHSPVADGRAAKGERPDSSHRVGRTALPTGPNRLNGKVCSRQLSKSNCKLGALESQRMGMRKGTDSLSSEAAGD